MNTNGVREKLRAGEATIGSFLGLGSPNIAELMGHAGFDWLVIESEHNGLDSAEIQHMLMAVGITNAVPIVRIPSSNPVYIQKALDMGAMGIVVPFVSTADEGEALVAATRFQPGGTRSWGPLRASAYTMDTEDYLHRANDNILVVLIIETKEAVDNLEAISAVPGVDVLNLGPWDLSLALGLDPLQLPLPEVDAITDRAVALGREHGVAVGAGCGSPDAVQGLIDRGIRFISYGPDYGLMVNAARGGIEAFRESASRRR